MNRTLVVSNNIKSIGFEPNGSIGILEVEFLTGDIYQYINIPTFLYQGLMTAESKGNYFDKNIKSKYTGRKLQKRALTERGLQAACRIANLTGFRDVDVIAAIIDEEMAREQREHPRFGDLVRIAEKVTKK